MAQPTPAHPALMEAQALLSQEQRDAPIPPAILTTKRLFVRAMHPSDAPTMSDNANDQDVIKYMSLLFPNPYTVAEAEKWISMNLDMEPPQHFVIIESSAPDVIIGGIGLKLGSNVESHVAEVGFWIGKKYWGRGYTTEVLEEFTRWSFESWVGKDGRRVKKLSGLIFDGNVASMRCFEKCGYPKEGVQKGHVEKHGVVMDLHLYGLTKADWESQQRSKSDTQ